MSRPMVSVMLPARSAAETLEEAARSCLEQTWEDLELLLIENDSTPDTIEVMRALQASDPRVRRLETPAGAGFIAALNLGWQEARGTYLARMDADDRSLPLRLERQVAFLNQEEDLAACGTLVQILRRESGGRLGPPAEGYARFEAWLNSVVEADQVARERFVDSPVANPSAMIRREAMAELGGYRVVSWAEDYDFWLRLLERGGKVAKVPEVLLQWIDSENRLTRTDPHYEQSEFLRAKAHFLARMKEVREHGVVICGAGPIGKQMSRFLAEEGIRVQAFLEVSRKRIGNHIDGIPVFGEEWMGERAPEAIVIGAVGQPGGRQRIRTWLQPHRVCEGKTFFCVA